MRIWPRNGRKNLFDDLQPLLWKLHIPTRLHAGRPSCFLAHPSFSVNMSWVNMYRMFIVR